jgi:RecA-family ATPase
MSAIRPLDLKAIAAQRPQPIDFVLPGLAAGTVGIVVSPGGTGKSMLLLSTVLAVAMGRDVGRIWGSDPTAGKTCYIGLEDPEDVLKIRLHDLLSYASADELDLAADQASFLPAFGRGWSVVSKTPQGIITSPRFEATAAALTAARPRLIVIDTFNRALGGADENSNGDVGQVLAVLEGLARTSGAAIVLAHHVSKASMRDGSGSEQHASRGASALVDNARWMAALSVMTPDDAAKRGIEDDVERRSWVRLDVPKVNYGAPVEPRWLQRRAGGVLAADVPPPAMKGKSNGKKRSIAEGEDAEISW